ncbi:unnamed protein product [Hyaloperonospora brassicae]|uniref:Spp2/MOS2 G-patch domain-containing protein n=1 Tax=Hyaloperonospora brassicae TaxID=162125 RepID=A0AAV0URX8_HYABA|nr:unnamed protein product [Hyaloperonospora brassicae]
MALSAFALKKSKKKTLAASAGFAPSAPAAPHTFEKIFVTDYDPNALVVLAQDGSKPLVIPLRETNSWNTIVKETTEDGDKRDEDGSRSDRNADKCHGPKEVDASSMDQQVAAAICAEAAQGRAPSSALNLVIPLADEREKKRAELFQDGAKRLREQQQKPILQQNAVPGMDALQDVADKYRHDVALRPDALDVHSDVYESVPVEAFGAALLRGMGWKGDKTMDDDVQKTLQPRHKLLGLGATKRPTLAGESQGKKKKRKKKMESKEKVATEASDERSGLDAGDRKDDRRRFGKRTTDQERRCSPSRVDRRQRSRSGSRGRKRDHSSDRRDRDRSRDRDRRRRSRSQCSRSDRRNERR